MQVAQSCDQFSLLISGHMTIEATLTHTDSHSLERMWSPVWWWVVPQYLLAARTQEVQGMVQCIIHRPEWTILD